MEKRNAVMLADTRPALVGTVLLQLQRTNPGLFEEAIIYYQDNIREQDRALMNAIIPCRFVKYAPRFQGTCLKSRGLNDSPR